MPVQKSQETFWTTLVYIYIYIYIYISIHAYIYIYTYILVCIHTYIKSKVKLATLVESDLKAPFLIATTLRCRGGCYSFPWIVKQGDIKHHFLSLRYDSTWDWNQVSRAIGEHSNHYANVRYTHTHTHTHTHIYIYIYIYFFSIQYIWNRE